MIIYQFNCFSENSNVGETSRQFGKSIKENIQKANDKFFKMSNKENKSNRVVNALKSSAIAEHLVNNLN